MREPKGAFVEACEFVINKDMVLKAQFIQDMLDGKREWPEGVSPFELIFGDFMAFADKLEKALQPSKDPSDDSGHKL